MTYEYGICFLMDYLNGDKYFHTAYDDHNLVRARTQFALVADMEKKKEQMKEITKNIAKRKKATQSSGFFINHSQAVHPNHHQVHLHTNFFQNCKSQL